VATGVIAFDRRDRLATRSSSSKGTFPRRRRVLNTYLDQQMAQVRGEEKRDIYIYIYNFGKGER